MTKKTVFAIIQEQWQKGIAMACKATSVYLTVTPIDQPLKSVLRKTFFVAAELRKFVNSPEFKEKYPESQYRIITEVY